MNLQTGHAPQFTFTRESRSALSILPSFLSVALHSRVRPNAHEVAHLKKQDPKRQTSSRVFCGMCARLVCESYLQGKFVRCVFKNDIYNYIFSSIKSYFLIVFHKLFGMNSSRKTRSFMKTTDIRKLSDSELLEQTEKAVLVERESTNLVLDHLREIQSRRLYARLGFSSMFEYCTQHLKYCNSGAQLRIDAMRLSLELPEIKESLEKGDLSLSVIGSFQKFVRHEKQKDKKYSREEKQELLKQVESKSRVEAEKVFAEISPEAFPKEKVKILNETQSELRLVADEELMELIAEMKAKLQQKGSTDPSYAEIFKCGLRKALKKEKGFAGPGATSPKEMGGAINGVSKAFARPNSTSSAEVKVGAKNAAGKTFTSSGATSPEEVRSSYKPSRTSRVYISVSSKKTAFSRAGEQCTYFSELTGKRCTEKHFLQVEHIIPVAMGGSSDQENLTVLCACHNRLSAIDSFGMEKMRSYLKHG